MEVVPGYAPAEAQPKECQPSVALHKMVIQGNLCRHVGNLCSPRGTVPWAGERGRLEEDPTTMTCDHPLVHHWEVPWNPPYGMSYRSLEQHYHGVELQNCIQQMVSHVVEDGMHH